MPQGAFYAFPNIRALGCLVGRSPRLLDEAGVACLSGTAFGSWGEGYLRLSYANSIDNLTIALGAIEDFCQAAACASGPIGHETKGGSGREQLRRVGVGRGRGQEPR